jgi:hypothetical protein
MKRIRTSHSFQPDCFMLIYGVEPVRLFQLKAELRAKATMLYMIDHRENKREFCERRDEWNANERIPGLYRDLESYSQWGIRSTAINGP